MHATASALHCQSVQCPPYQYRGRSLSSGFCRPSSVVQQKPSQVRVTILNCGWFSPRNGQYSHLLPATCRGHTKLFSIHCPTRASWSDIVNVTNDAGLGADAGSGSWFNNRKGTHQNTKEAFPMCFLEGGYVTADACFRNGSAISRREIF